MLLENFVNLCVVWPHRAYYAAVNTLRQNLVILLLTTTIS
jgi:hypothetical protein